jgi:hypothetical protein
MTKLQNTLGADNSEKLREFIRLKESGSRQGDYQIENRFGYIGAYQFGAQALQDQGLIKPGVVTAYSKLGAQGHKDVLDNPANWNNPPGSKAGFLANKGLQDQAFDKLANSNYNTLTRKGVINADTPAADVAGYVSASHLVGAGSVIKSGLTKTDANGTSAGKYFNEGKAYVSGKTGFPPDKPRGTTAPDTSTAPAKREVFNGADRKLRDTRVGNSVTIGGSSAPEVQQIPLPLINPLSRFSSFNAVMTLSSISAEQHKRPLESYKAGFLGEIVLRSAGGGSRLQETDMTTADNPSGQYDFFIDNLEMQSIISHNEQTKGSNATDISFEVREPYSMGVFLQSCEVAARKNGWKNGYLNSIFLLTIQFVGFDSDGNSSLVENVTRHIPMTVKDIAMSVKAGGATYRVKCHPSNEIVHNNNYSLFQSDIAVSGKTVREILQTGEFSLQTVLNKRLQELAEKQKAPTAFDEIVIVFPKPNEDVSQQFDPNSDKPQTATNQPTQTITVSRTDSASTLTQSEDTLNDIGLSVMDFDSTTAGESKVNQQNTVQEDASKPVKKSKVVNDSSTRQFIYSQGTSIINAISSIMQHSKYCKDAVEDKNIDELGMVNWFRIESQVDYRPPKEGNIGNNDDPKLLIFKIVPYKAHSSKISAGGSRIKGYDKLRQEAAKVYDYIYTGKNTEIIDLEIEFQRAFFNTVAADNGKGNNTAAQTGRDGAAAGTTSVKTPNNRPEVKDSLMGNVGMGYRTEVNTEAGGTTSEDYRTLVAKQFQKALYDSRTDLMTATMSIFGDPYFLADSGMGNFSNTGSGRFNVTDTNAMDYQSGEVDVIINFRTPLDYGNDGIMSFGNTKIVESFSGLYKVNFVLHRISRGKFTQELKLMRRTRQAADSVEEVLPNVLPDNGSSGYEVRDETGQLSTLRRNEYGELYDPTGASSASANPNAPKSSKVTTVVTASSATGVMTDAEKNETFISNWMFP